MSRWGGDWVSSETKPDGTIVLYSYPRPMGGTDWNGQPLSPFIVRHFLELKIVPISELRRA